MSRFKVLNSQVKEALLCQGAELWIAFYAFHPGYDVDIDPLHNPDKVESFKKKEEELLERAIQLVDDVKAYRRQGL